VPAQSKQRVGRGARGKRPAPGGAASASPPGGGRTASFRARALRAEATVRVLAEEHRALRRRIEGLLADLEAERGNSHQSVERWCAGRWGWW